MPPESGGPLPRYRGPWVKFDGDGITYSVWIDPPPPGAEPRQFGSKHEAWGHALWEARERTLPLRDLTEPNAHKLIEK